MAKSSILGMQSCNNQNAQDAQNAHNASNAHSLGGGSGRKAP